MNATPKPITLCNNILLPKMLDIKDLKFSYLEIIKLVINVFTKTKNQILNFNLLALVVITLRGNCCNRECLILTVKRLVSSIGTVQ